MLQSHVLIHHVFVSITPCRFQTLDSVLCGSKKYPSRDPFAHLLKGSLQTFLNAMTYPDRTVYPVSILILLTCSDSFGLEPKVLLTH